jgi:EAL domain-containing protein (putative c-di-GMP-specific phosphodiesterase class I)
MEALARWWVPSEGWRPPDRWIPVAEERGLIIPFGRWALSTVLEQISVLRSRGHGRVPVAVNLSPLQLEDIGFVDFLRAELERHGVSAADLDLELTEHHFQMPSDRLRPVLEALRALGCRVHLDDYGTGDSSLQSVFQLPIDAIKIDRAFVRGLPGDPASAAIVDSTVMMAHRMGLRVIAEGVETLEQRGLPAPDRLRPGAGLPVQPPDSAAGTLRHTRGVGRARRAVPRRERRVLGARVAAGERPRRPVARHAHRRRR